MDKRDWKITAINPFTAPNLLNKTEYHAKDRKKDWHYPRCEPSCDLFVSQKLLQASNQRLNEKIELVKGKNIAFEKQWNDLTEKEKVLNENFIKFNKFVKENKEKSERAGIKIAEERKSKQDSEQKIRALREDYDEMLSVKQKLDAKIKQYIIYVDYLYSVVESVSEFKNIDEILARFESYAAAKSKLTLKLQNDFASLENAKNQMSKLVETNCMVILGLHNSIATIQKRYEVSHFNTLKWESLVTQIKDKISQNMADFSQLKLAIWYSYVSMCKKRRVVPNPDRNNIEEQLIFIKGTLSQLNTVNRMLKKKKSAADRSATPSSIKIGKN